MIAINDSFILEQLLYKVRKQNSYERDIYFDEALTCSNCHHRDKPGFEATYLS